VPGKYEKSASGKTKGSARSGETRKENASAEKKKRDSTDFYKTGTVEGIDFLYGSEKRERRRTGV